MRVLQSDETIQRYVEKYDMASFLNSELLRHLQLFSFQTTANVYREQDQQHYLYFLVEGSVQCSHYHLNGQAAVFALSSPFTVIGDLEIMSDLPVWSDVIAVEETTMLGIASDIIAYYGADDPKFLRFLIEQLREKLYKAGKLHVNQGLPVLHRLVMYILAQQPQDGVVILPGKEHLASLLGTTTRHLNRVLSQLVEMDAIDGVYPRLRVLDRSLLLTLPG